MSMDDAMTGMLDAERRLTTVENGLAAITALLNKIDTHLQGMNEWSTRLSRVESERTADQSAIGRAFGEVDKLRLEINGLGTSVNTRFASVASETNRIDSRLSKWVYLLSGAGTTLAVLFGIAKAAAVFFIPGIH
jgi:hypothetical protein